MHLILDGVFGVLVVYLAAVGAFAHGAILVGSLVGAKAVRDAAKASRRRTEAFVETAAQASKTYEEVRAELRGELEKHERRGPRPAPPEKIQ